MAIGRHQQTVEVAIDTTSGEEYWAVDLLHLSEQVFSDLRRSAMRERIARGKGGTAARFICAACKRPLYLSRRNHEEGNRWFSHDRNSPDCPWSEGPRLSKDQFKAVQYRGQQEGPEHRRLKEFLALWLERTPDVTEVSPEKVTLGQVLKGEWKRPDVQCLWRGQRIVFELQLSYEFLSHVIKRDDFYREERIFIIWVFRAIDLHRATVTDEAFFNRRNLFVLDDAAIAQTIESGQLSLSGYHQTPQLAGAIIEDTWTNKLVTLDDLTFPTSNYRPFFSDYEAAKQKIEQNLSEQRQRDADEFDCGVQCYVESITKYYRYGYTDDSKQDALKQVDRLCESSHWRSGFESLRDEEFFGWHRTLPVLLSIKLDAPTGYGCQTAFQVLEAGLRQSTPRARGQFGFAVLYLWAYGAYRPRVTEDQRRWIRKRAQEIKGSVESGKDTYSRYTAFDEAIMLLFPDLKEKLVTPWATRMMELRRHPHEEEPA